MNQLELHLTCPNVSIVLHIFRDSLRDGGLPGPRPASNKKCRNSSMMSVTDERSHFRVSDSLPPTNFVRLCAINLTSANVLHFATISVRPGSALTGGWLGDSEYAEINRGMNLLEHGGTIRGSAFFSDWGRGILIHINA